MNMHCFVSENHECLNFFNDFQWGLIILKDSKYCILTLYCTNIYKL